jgi:hypothetical protein
MFRAAAPSIGVYHGCSQERAPSSNAQRAATAQISPEFRVAEQLVHGLLRIAPGERVVLRRGPMMEAIAIEVLGAGGKAHVFHQMTLAARVWTIRGQAGIRFFQRFQGTFSDDGRTIAAYWERSEDGQSWRRDFDIRYTKAQSA